MIIVLLPLLALQQPDTTPTALLGELPAYATCAWNSVPAATGARAGGMELRLHFGNPLFGVREVAATVSASGEILQYRESIDRPMRAPFSSAAVSLSATASSLVVWFTAGRPTSGRVMVPRKRDELHIEPLGMQRAATLAAAVRARCADRVLGPNAPRAVLARLPRIDFARQCPENRCDRRIEDSVFTVLERVVPQAVERNMPLADVRARLGAPPRAYGVPETWRRARDGARMELWTYARSLSGTQGYFLVFENDRLRAFQRAQRAWILEHYGPASLPR